MEDFNIGGEQGRNRVLSRTGILATAVKELEKPMNSKTISLSLFLFFMARSFLFAGGQSGEDLRKELQEEHNIMPFRYPKRQHVSYALYDG